MVSLAQHPVSPVPSWHSEIDNHAVADIHCHCLAGMDDGPATMQQAADLCRVLVDDGFTHVVATPHQLGRYHGQNTPTQIRHAVAALQAELTRQQIPLAVLSGGDVRIDERLPRLLAEDQVMTLADGRKYLMLELPHEVFVEPRMMIEQLGQLGYRTIISHPERHYPVQRDVRCVLAWLERGAVLQITAGSLLGQWGPAAQHTAWDLLASGYAAVAATDAHNSSTRRPCMSAAKQAITARLGAVAADTLCVANPLRLLQGQEVLPLGRIVLQARKATGDNRL